MSTKASLLQVRSARPCQEESHFNFVLRRGYTMRRMLEVNVLGQYGANVGANIGGGAAGYTMRQIAQYWKQTFGSGHSLHSSIGSIL